MGRRASSAVGREPVTAAGAPLLSHNHAILLEALLDRPGARVGSYDEWLRAALPLARAAFGRCSPWGLRQSMRTLHPAWAAREKRGSRKTVALTPRGRAVVDRQVPARVRGYGEYRGRATFRRASSGGAGRADPPDPAP